MLLFHRLSDQTIRWKGQGHGGGLLLVLAVFCFLLVTRHQWSADIRDSDDDVTYLSYAMSLGIDGDLDFSNELKCCKNMALNGRVPGGFYGAGLMAAPFVGAFSQFDRFEGHPVIADRQAYLHSWSYFGFSFAVHAYFLAAVFLLWRVAQRLYPDARLPVVLLMALGSGVYYFVFARPRMAHGFEFFALALTLNGAIQLAFGEGRRILAAAAKAALGAVLAVAVRFSDLNLVALAPLLLLAAAAKGETGFGRKFRAYALMLALALIPLAWFNFLVYDHAFLTSKVVYGVSTQMSAVEGVQQGLVDLILQKMALFSGLPTLLFGSEFGLLYTDPVAVLGVGCLIAWLVARAKGPGRRPALAALLLVLAYSGFSLLIVLIWKSPGMSFGYRTLFPLFPLGFAGWWLWLAQAGPVWPRILKPLLIALCLLSLCGQALFTKTPALGYRDGVSALGLEGKTAVGFMPNLLGEMTRPAAWSVALKDGPYGYLGKMYFSKAYRDWLVAQWNGKTVKMPERQHPPIDGLFLALLAALWGGAFFLMLRAGTNSSRVSA